MTGRSCCTLLCVCVCCVCCVLSEFFLFVRRMNMSFQRRKYGEGGSWRRVAAGLLLLLLLLCVCGVA